VIGPPAEGEDLDRSLASLSAQIYREFEVFASSPRPAVPGLADIALREIAGTQHPAEVFNAALNQTTGQFIIAIEAGDVLPPHALYVAARAALDHPGARLIYADDDELGANGARQNPFFKPDWSPELALAFNYVGRAVFFAAAALRAQAGARAEAGDAWQWDLALRLAQGDHVQHIPHVLLHQGSPARERRRREIAAGREVVAQALARRHEVADLTADPRGWFAIRRRLPPNPPHVTIVIPTRDRCDLLRRCLDGILARTTYPSFDVLIVDNMSREAETARYFKTLAGDPRVRVVPYPAEFNFAKLHNDIVPLARGDMLALLNNDLDVIGGDWLDIMVGHALAPDVGAVGAKLYFPDDTIQHAGVIIGLFGVAAHIYGGLPRAEPGPHGLAMVAQELSAVTAACLVLRRAVFAEIGGMDEVFAVDYNDIDFCLRLRQRGYRIVWAANAELHHHESATRGNYHGLPDTPGRKAKLARYERELALFRARWRDVVDDDPFYNPNLTVEALDRSLAFPPRAGRHWKRRLVGS
jgi:GT2 family glycosyltransferase